MSVMERPPVVNAGAVGGTGADGRSGSRTCVTVTFRAALLELRPGRGRGGGRAGGCVRSAGASAVHPGGATQRRVQCRGGRTRRRARARRRRARATRAAGSCRRPRQWPLAVAIELHPGSVDGPARRVLAEPGREQQLRSGRDLLRSSRTSFIVSCEPERPVLGVVSGSAQLDLDGNKLLLHNRLRDSVCYARLSPDTARPSNAATKRWAGETRGSHT